MIILIEYDNGVKIKMILFESDTRTSRKGEKTAETTELKVEVIIEGRREKNLHRSPTGSVSLFLRRICQLTNFVNNL